MSTSPLLSLLWLLGSACAMQASGRDVLPKVSKYYANPSMQMSPAFLTLNGGKRRLDLYLQWCSACFAWEALFQASPAASVALMFPGV